MTRLSHALLMLALVAGPVHAQAFQHTGGHRGASGGGARPSTTAAHPAVHAALAQLAQVQQAIQSRVKDDPSGHRAAALTALEEAVTALKQAVQADGGTNPSSGASPSAPAGGHHHAGGAPAAGAAPGASAGTHAGMPAALQLSNQLSAIKLALDTHMYQDIQSTVNQASERIADAINQLADVPLE